MISYEDFFFPLSRMPVVSPLKINSECVFSFAMVLGVLFVCFWGGNMTVEKKSIHPSGAFAVR